MSKIKYFKRFRPHDLKNLASKLVVKNFKGGEILCDQGELCRNLFIIKNGQISLSKVIKKSTIDISEYPSILKEALSMMPETLEIEVKQKYNAGDVLLMTEILTSLPSKYRIRVMIPSQLYICTVFDLQRHVGMHVFGKVPDSDFFTSNDSDVLKHFVETKVWEKYKASMVNSHLLEIAKKNFYCDTKMRSNNQVSLAKIHEIDNKTKEYFKEKQEFFDIDKFQRYPLVKLSQQRHDQKIKNWERLKKESLSKNNEQSCPFSVSKYPTLKSLSPNKNPLPDIELNEESQNNEIPAKKPMIHNNYVNQLDDDHLDAIFKYQYKKIISAAYIPNKQTASAKILPVHRGTGELTFELPTKRTEEAELQSHATINRFQTISHLPKAFVLHSKASSKYGIKTLTALNHYRTNSVADVVSNQKSLNKSPYFTSSASPTLKSLNFHKHHRSMSSQITKLAVN